VERKDLRVGSRIGKPALKILSKALKIFSKDTAFQTYLGEFAGVGCIRGEVLLHRLLSEVPQHVERGETTPACICVLRVRRRIGNNRAKVFEVRRMLRARKWAFTDVEGKVERLSAIREGQCKTLQDFHVCRSHLRSGCDAVAALKLSDEKQRNHWNSWHTRAGNSQTRG
jgi:hypothetical protein